MGYAPHLNSDVRASIRAFGKSEIPLILGCFTEVECGKFFEYSVRKWHLEEMNPEMPHVIYLTDGSTRLAKVLKTRVHVLIDEDTIEVWKIKQHRKYDTDWVF